MYISQLLPLTDISVNGSKCQRYLILIRLISSIYIYIYIYRSIEDCATIPIKTNFDRH